MASRILALDYGTKRIGVALSDELGWTAQPLETFERRTLERDIGHIRDLVHAHEVVRVVLGLPLRLSGEVGPAARVVQEFVVRLAEALPVPIDTWDERMTTKAAEELLIAADVSRKKRKGALDRVAAALLLQSYLEAQSLAVSPSDPGADRQDRVEEGTNGPDQFQSFETASNLDRARSRAGGRRSGHLPDDAMD